MRIHRLGILLIALLAGCASDGSGQAEAPAEPAAGAQTAIFGGGCFWCVEEAFDKVDGVISTTSGFSGGRVQNPTYEQVASGRTSHVEVVQVTYDPERVSYADLLNTFWHNIDPFAENAQFCDHGAQYRSVIFYGTERERELAERSREVIAERFSQPVATDVEAAPAFYPAEEYHQDYYEKNPLRYRFYKYTCGRAQRLDEIW